MVCPVTHCDSSLARKRITPLTAGFELFMKFFSSPPTHGANLLYEGALGKNSNETGVFLFKDRITVCWKKYPIYIAMNFLEGMFKLMAECQKRKAPVGLERPLTCLPREMKAIRIK